LFILSSLILFSITQKFPGIIKYSGCLRNAASDMSALLLCCYFGHNDLAHRLILLGANLELFDNVSNKLNLHHSCYCCYCCCWHCLLMICILMFTERAYCVTYGGEKHKNKSLFSEIWTRANVGFGRSGYQLLQSRLASNFSFCLFLCLIHSV